VGAMSVESIFIMVVFPAPFGPSSPKISPCMTSNDTRSTAVTDSNRLVRLVVVIAFIHHTKKECCRAAVYAVVAVFAKCLFAPLLIRGGEEDSACE